MAQKVLMISYKNQLRKYHLNETASNEIIIGNDWSNDITFPALNNKHMVEWDEEKVVIDGQLLSGNEPVITENGLLEIYLLDLSIETTLDILGYAGFSIGNEPFDDVQVPEIKVNLLFKQEETELLLEVYEGEVYHNFTRLHKTAKLEPGDQLFIQGCFIRIGGLDTIEMNIPSKQLSTKLTILHQKTSTFSGDYPDYHRSPRIIYREPDEKKVIAKPPNKLSKPSEQLGRMVIPSLVMIAALVIVSVIQPRGIFIIVMLSMTVTTVIVSVVTYIKNVKKYKADMKHRDKTYRAYLQRKMIELHQTSEEQRHALEYHYPDVEEIQKKARNVDARIYEKTMFHHDFLYFRTGLGQTPSSFEIDFQEEEFTQDEDELINKARDLLTQFKDISDVPVVTSLTKGPVGYIGPRHLVIEQLQQFVMQISLFHSYHDVQFITIFPEVEKADWDWARWLPHAKLQDLNVRGFVYHERSRDQVLHSMYQVLKERRLAIDEKENKNEKIYFSPHYVILITDETIILDHTIMEFLNEDPAELGVSLVFVQDVLQQLPEHVTTVINLQDSTRGNIVLEEGELVNKNFILDHFPSDFNKEAVARGLAPLNHLQSLKNSIPESVTFLEMYGVDKVEELDIANRWRQNETYKSMSVPLGLRGKDDIVELNLHEKAHGPHGLVAGTTGSGKSEIIQSYIISLAVNFHPYEVSFLLIDYKGGGMANLFKDMPHLLGTITNLDRAQALRALASIKAELNKRQRLFGEHEVNHINQYQKLYKQGKVQEAMPHLYIISDEFAELKAEQPDFMQELVSTARIGRSLGIHLILATQKPSGVVDDQIWSNSKFKLALKVQNETDSKEVLKTADAAEITLPGRAYLQVGNNEIYELFQSAWSGADYVPDTHEHHVIDTTIYAINDLGQYTILTEDLSGLDKKEEVTSVPTELDAVIGYLQAFTETKQIEPLPPPWLPPLTERMIIRNIHAVDFKEAWEEQKKPLEATIGMLDQPEIQAQNPMTLNLTEDGHIGLFSSPGYGKSTMLQTLIVDLVKQHSPAHLHIYLLDFGTNGLLPLKGLPHVADPILLDEEEKVGKWIRMMSQAIRDRKRKLSEYNVANIEMYEAASGETVPNILIALDNYDAVKDAEFNEVFNKMMTQIAREGAGIGIHLTISAGRQNAMRMPLLSNIKIQIALYLIDKTETFAITGRTDLEIEEIPGRGIIKLEEPTLLQVALPNDGEETLEVIEGIQALGQTMSEHWTGEVPEEIPMMPEGAIDFMTFRTKKRVRNIVTAGELPLGLEFEEVTPLSYNPVEHTFLTVVSDRKDRLDQLTNSVTQNMTLLTDVYQTKIFDTNEKSLAEYEQDFMRYIWESSKIEEEKKLLIKTIQEAHSGINNKKKQLILIKDWKDFVTRSQLKEEEMLVLLEQGPTVGFHLIVCGDYHYVGGSYDFAPRYIRRQSTIGIVAMKLGDQDIFNQPFIRKEKYPDVDECYYAMDQQHIKIKIPR